MFNQQAANARQLEEIRDEQDVIICHHCHAKVQIIDIGNGASIDDMMDCADFDDVGVMERMGGEEMAIIMGVNSENLDQQM